MGDQPIQSGTSEPPDRHTSPDAGIPGMDKGTDGADSYHLDLVISKLLLIGVSLSLVIIAVGTTLTLVAAATKQAARSSITDLRHGSLELPALTVPHTVHALLSGIGRFDGPAVAMLGLLLLIATPMARVAASAFVFLAVRDAKFALITLAVLVILLGSFEFGHLVSG